MAADLQKRIHAAFGIIRNHYNPALTTDAEIDAALDAIIDPAEAVKHDRWAMHLALEHQNRPDAPELVIEDDDTEIQIENKTNRWYWRTSIWAFKEWHRRARRGYVVKKGERDGRAAAEAGFDDE